MGSLLVEKLQRFSEHITRLEVHLSDQNGSKPGVNDKRCMLEVRLEGREPIAVKGEGDSYEHALHEAIGRVKSLLDTIVGKMRNHE